MKILINGIFVLLWLMVVNKSYSQNDRFDAGIIVGANFSALEGTELTDYFGLNAGIIGTMKLSNKHQLGIELLFSQNGEYILPEVYPLIEYGQIRLDHLEIPIHFGWLLTSRRRNKIQNFNINVGIAYVRLLSHFAEDDIGTDVSNQIIFNKKEAFHLQTGLTYNFSNSLGLNFKATVPIKVEDWTIAVRMIYMIN